MSALAVVALLVGMLVPVSAYASTRNWSLTRTPASISEGAPAPVQVTATNTGDSGGSEAIGCVIVAIPASAFTVTNVVIDSVSGGGAWSASFAGDGTWWYARLVAGSSGGDRLDYTFESVTATITVSSTGSDGTFTWTGNAYNKADCTDDFAMPRTLSVTVDSAVTDNPPVAQPDAYATGRNAPVTLDAPGVLANDIDPDGDQMTATQTSSPSNGSLAWGGDGSFTYTPDPGFVGSDEFTYHANAGAASSGDVTVTITVANNAPLAADDVYSTAWLQPLSVAAPGFLGNDSDPDGDGLSASIVSGPSNGTLLPAANGSFTYLPNLLFVGTDSFVYAVSDGLTSTQATVFINVANAAPVAAADGSYTVAEDTTLTVPAPGVLANDTDGDGDSLTAAIVADPTNGNVTMDPDGAFDYVPGPDFAGTDSFTYRASDGLDTSAITTVSITVTAVDDAPVASSDSYATQEDTPLAVPAPGVLGNDADADGDPVTAVILTAPSNGQLTLDPSGSLAYVPDADYHGADSFTYEMDDGTSTDSATVTLSVSPVNDAPVASPDDASTPHGISILVDVLVNDTDVDGDTLTISAVGIPSTGIATIESGRIRYTPTTGFAGPATFSYTTSDGSAIDSALVTVNVAPQPTPVPTPTPTATSRPTSSPAPTPAPTPDPPTQVAPDAEPSATSLPDAEGSPSPTRTPEPGSPSPSPSPTTGNPPIVPPVASGGGGGALQPLSTPELTTSFDPSGNLFEFTSLFGGFGGSFAWAMPAAMLGVPGLLFMLAVAGQLLGAAAWVPAIRRMLAGVGVRRRRER